MTLPRLLSVLLLAVLGCLLAVGVAWRPAEESAEPVAASPAPDRVAPLAVLVAWDRSRAEAWRRGDAAALARLYVAGSATGRADRTLLAAYAGRGLRVVGLTTQRAEVRVVTATDDRLVLVVTDRVVGGTAVGPEGRVGLPRDSWSRHRVVLRNAAGG
ncbi:MAG: hypothetical protein ACXWDL_14930, partial [Nocardioides sp.]